MLDSATFKLLKHGVMWRTSLWQLCIYSVFNIGCYLFFTTATLARFEHIFGNITLSVRNCSTVLLAL